MRIVFKFWDFENYYYLVDDEIYANLTTGHYLNDGEPEFEPLDPEQEAEYLQILATDPGQLDYELGKEDDFFHMKFRIILP